MNKEALHSRLGAALINQDRSYTPEDIYQLQPSTIVGLLRDDVREMFFSKYEVVYLRGRFYDADGEIRA